MDNDEKCSVRDSLTNPGYAIGVLLICGGLVLFLDNLGVFPFPVRRLFWPLVFLFYGGALLKSAKTAVALIWGCAALVAGILFLLNAFDILHVTVQVLWALALIASGIVMLIYRVEWPRRRGEHAGGIDWVHEFVLFSGAKRRVESANFEGGDLSSVFGGIELDLRRARISSLNREVVIEANAAFGGIEIRIPEEWRVSLQGNAIFGAYQDKSLPPRPEPGVISPVLIIRGGVAFGGVSIQN